MVKKYSNKIKRYKKYNKNDIVKGYKRYCNKI